MVATVIIRGTVWCFMKFVNVFYVPLFVIRIFQRSRRCPPVNDPILLMNATMLADKIRRRELTSETVVNAYITRIIEVNPIINAVVDERYSQAIEDARKIDRLLSSGAFSEDHLKSTRPLLGVPITVKESIAVEGLSNNAGHVCKRPKAGADADIVKLAREAGAIPLVASNTPELCLNWETNNGATGRTLNPYDTRKTPGGSSGGEASLLASAASVIGLGSDICGSLRLPAHFCGVWGHKPTPGVVSLRGHYPDCTNQETWVRFFTLGPMARYAEDLPLILNVIAKQEKRHELRLNEPVNLEDVNIYFVESINSLFTNDVDSEILAGMERLMNHMEMKYGIVPKKIDIKDLKYSPELSYLDLALGCANDIDFITDSNKGFLKELFRFMTFRSDSVFSTMLFGTLRSVLHRVPKSTREKIQDTLEEMKENVTSVLKDNSVLLFPPFPSAAHPHGDIYRKVFNCGYLSVFNALGLPATNCPMGFNSDGLPIGIQVVASPNCDRLTLAVAQEIEKTFGGWIPPKNTRVNRATG